MGYKPYLKDLGKLEKDCYTWLKEDCDLGSKVGWRDYHLALFWEMKDILRESVDWDREVEVYSTKSYI